MSIGTGLAMLGLFMFLIAFLVTDAWVFLQGRDSLLHKHTTAAEKEMQRLVIEKLRQDTRRPE